MEFVPISQTDTEPAGVLEVGHPLNLKAWQRTDSEVAHLYRCWSVPTEVA